MSVSRYMHPRNIYKVPPNFKQLAIDYPEFRKCVKMDITGKATLDFKDLASLKALSCTLLKKDFDLKVEIPLNKLIPTIPLRLNYILWIEDLMEISGKKEEIKGIDIGTGASCVYPLISAKKYGWSMLATEIDDESIRYAHENVRRNHLEDKIIVIKVNNSSLLTEAVQDGIFDFCMCNPPFFSSQKETLFEFKSRKDSRPRPKNAFTGSLGEVVAKGGEVDFITKLIHESKKLENNIRVFTTMLGHKSSLVPLKSLLREIDIVSFKQTEFCQGNTTRWGLAWTFFDIDLRQIPEIVKAALKKQKNKHPVQYTLPPEWNDANIEEVGNKLISIFNNLQINYKIFKHSKNVLGYTITANSNTWSHQRRKRREQKRAVDKSDSSEASTTMELSEEVSSNNNYDGDSYGKKNINQSQENSRTHNEEFRPTSPSVDATTTLISEMNVKSPGQNKRQLEDDDGYYNRKKLKLDEGSCEDICKIFMECNAMLRKDANGIHFGLVWGYGSASKDVMHQILQHVKNNLCKE